MKIMAVVVSSVIVALFGAAWFMLAQPDARPWVFMFGAAWLILTSWAIAGALEQSQ